MEDQKIIDLYWQRSEQAIWETDRKYGGYCYAIAYNILSSREDSEESVSDTYLAAWRSMPPKKPGILSSFLGKITRHLSIDRWRRKTADKRGGGETVLALEELENCVSGEKSLEESVQYKEMAILINRFLDSLPETERNVFLCRYWYVDTVQDVADTFGFSVAKVNSMLHRTRQKLRKALEKEGY